MSLPRKADVASFPREAQPDVGGLPSSAADRWRWWWLVAFAAVVSAMLARSTLTASFGHDEIEHAHVTWQLTQGLDPYVAFHQNHTPMLWLMAAPILEIMPVDVRAMIALRCLSLVSILVIAIMAVKVTRRLHGGHARLAELELWVVIATALLASALGANRFRPDAPMAACVAIAGGLLVLHRAPRPDHEVERVVLVQPIVRRRLRRHHTLARAR